MKLRNAVCTTALSVFLPPLFPPVLAAPINLNIPKEHRDLLSIELTDDTSAVRLAGICFLPDCETYSLNFDNVNSDTAWCEDHGYQYSCPNGTAADYSQTCPRDESYAKCTKEQYCKNNNYDKTFDYCRAQGPTWYPDESTKCPNGLDLYKECKEDTGRACEENDKFMTCSVGRPSKNDSDICEWNSDYSKCCTDTPSKDCPANSKVTGCSGSIVGKDSCGYDCYQCCLTTCPAGYAYTDAQTSGGTTGYVKDGTDYCNHCTKGKLYKRKQNPCTGYSTCSAYGGIDNGNYCYTGSTKKYSSCRTECQTGYIEWCTTPVTNCTTLGYTQSSSACSGKPAVACPFDSTKWYCANTASSGQSCSYTFSASQCRAQCKNVGTKSCTKNGTTYYESCGSFRCSSSQICNNGTCQISSRPVSGPTSGECCVYSGCGDDYESDCQNRFGRSCYAECMSRHGVTCSDMQASCVASGGTPRFQTCINIGTSYNGAVFGCW